ncbi:rhomboid family intramembrane serine protease [Auraticoccus sp. F435]|uniref:Rhomboid family intramembrane serine protease n=1 Tax=Auraticoccus cholistanensis TaxID=2656650 RepID=A0A6A9UW83_9ACTN|nr:rhomboid family intramembrane serine protease [Auraticoccus cholistanensis]MVA76968.1 rhomboid family intramembrane serine protease [Auraticoccus cholistanensis]
MSTTLEPRGRLLGAVAPALPPLVLTVLMWLSELVDTVLGGFLDQFGIQPREVDGLAGVLASPLLHSGLAHLVANTGAFVVLGVLTALITRRFWAATLGIAVLGGLAVWLLGADGTVHIGASGLVYGYATFLFCWGIFVRRALAMAASLFVLLAYGGIVWGVLPTQSGVSWEGHLFGALAGVLMAWLLARRQRVVAGRRR